MAKKQPRSKKKPAAKKKKTASRPARQPKAQQLPHTDGTRDADLDNYCEEIGDARERLASAKSDETDGIAAALTHMRDNGISKYQHAGIRLTFLPGRDKLAVKVVKEKEVSGGDGPADAADADTGEKDE